MLPPWRRRPRRRALDWIAAALVAAALPVETVWIVTAGGFLAWIVAFSGFILAFGAGFCGGGGVATTVAWVGLFLVYFAVAAWALLGRYRPLWGLPLAVALAELVYVGALAALPGGRATCGD